MVTARSMGIRVATLLFAVPAVTSAASFNCAKATIATDLMICGDPQLSVMDDDLANLYRQAKAVAPDSAAFKKETNEEWHRRKRCGDRDCLAIWYQHRTEQLTTLLERVRSSEASIKSISPPTAQTPAPVSTLNKESNGLPVFLWFIAGLSGFFWVVKKLGHAGRRPAAVSEARGNANRVPLNEPPPRGAAKTFLHTKSLQSVARSGPAIPTTWTPPGQATLVNGVKLPGGMLYVGSSLTASDGSIEAAQIDPGLPVDSRAADPQERLFGYWPRYDAISATARRAYLTWLASGRRDPNADVGYVFLFFYGLERRVLVDAKSDPKAMAEVPAIVAEVESLRSIYGNRSFQSYTSSFLDYVSTLGKLSTAEYRNEPPVATLNRGMPLRLRAGLGQCAVDDQPVPATWALAWVRSEPNVHIPRAAARCPDQFDRLFQRIYGERYGEGIRLKVNRTKLKISYRAASGSLLAKEFKSDFGDLPDVTTVVAPLKQLQAIVDESAQSLDSYSRFVGRHADKAESLEANILLPRELWSASVRVAVDDLDQRVGTGMVVVKLEEVLSALGGATNVTRGILKQLRDVLHVQTMGVEPDVLAGAKTPKADDWVVLFRLPANEAAATSATDSAYAAVAVMLDLAITLANADGKISGREVQFLNRQIDAWAHVGDSAQRRLRARLRLGILYPPTLASLRHRIEPLPLAARSGLAKLLSALALADGKLPPSAVKHLEKVHQLLGIDRSVLYSALHVESAAAEEPPAVSAASKAVSIKAAPLDAPADHVIPPRKVASTPGSLNLNAERISALQIESERVTALLSKVFEEEVRPESVATPAKEIDSEASERVPRLLGLDAGHSAFLRVLMARPSWSRAELNDIAADMEIMLDGALERVNEAALDNLDARIAEGDDPIEIAQDLLESTIA